MTSPINAPEGATSPDDAITVSADGPPSDAKVSGGNLRRQAIIAAAIFGAVFVVCVLVYLALAVPGQWFPSASIKTWNATNLTLTRGVGHLAGDELVVTSPDPNSITLLSLVTDFRSSDYPGVAWVVKGLAEDADVRLLWTSDVRPDKLNSAAIEVSGGRSLPTVVQRNPAWLGHIKGLALAIHGPLPQPVQIKGVVATPLGAADVLRDRLHEWFAFETWNGTSINTIVGGADHQEVPLPVLLALVVGLSGLAFMALRRWRPGNFAPSTPAFLATLFLVAWLLLDARWGFNLMRQEQATNALFLGKDARAKHLVNDDGPLFAFIEKARAVLPSTPVRIVIVADADYFRGRAAYHLYPNNVYFNPRSNEIPAATLLHAGDWLLVFQRRGIQYDRSQGRLRWDNGQTVNAELKLVEPGGALFLIR